MPRYVDVIEAEAAIKDLFADMPRIEFMGNRRRWREENEQYLRCLEVLRSLPTADVVEVVRCKDCKYWKTVGASVAKFCTCIVNTEVMKDEDDYCSLGERKYNED